MTKNADGVWVYTIPLPTGTYNYRFYVGGAAGAALTDYTGAILAYDPTNPPLMAHEPAGEQATSMQEYNFGRVGEEFISSVFVPWDPVKQARTTRVDEEAPRRGENGQVSFVKYTLSDGKVTYFGIYLPYGFDKNRAEKYPIIVLFHGGGGYEGSWMSNGLPHIMDNLIAENRIIPTVVVTPCGSDFFDPPPATVWDVKSIMDYVTKDILPYMEQNYNCTTDPSRRALAGLSAGGRIVFRGYFHNYDTFNYFIAMSASLITSAEPDFKNPTIKSKHILFTGGQYDNQLNMYLNPNYGAMGQYWVQQELVKAGVPFMVKNDFPYAHQWTQWRQAIVFAADNFLWK
jgi:enterochelin esterase-like enzyme